MTRDLYSTTDEDEFKKLSERIEKTEDVSDRMEQEIGKYLGDVGDAHLSDDTKEKIRAMLRQIGELESIGDSCFGLARIMRRKRDNQITFNDEQQAGVEQMFTLVDQALTRMNELLAGRREDYDLTASEELENSINGCRNRLKQWNISNLDQHIYSYDNGTVFSDLINEFEKNGDYIINVAESRLRATRTGIRFKGIYIDTEGKTVSIDGEPVAFTKTEYEMLKMFMMNRGMVFSREDLLQAIWPDDVVVNARTVDVNITRIRKKIEPYADHLTTRAGFGYSFQE
jgi:phosphate:Na+ symporter